MSLYFGICDHNADTKDYEWASKYYKSQSARDVFYFCRYEGKSIHVEDCDQTVFRPSQRIIEFALLIFEKDEVATKLLQTLLLDTNACLWVSP